MGIRVNTACEQVIAKPIIFPERVRQAASRLTDFFGDRRFGSIGRDDFASYVCAVHRPGHEGAEPLGACYDLHILGTLAGFADEIALWELIQTWIEENHADASEVWP